ncbi:MAG: 4-hydroxy-3-methylbut-2-enyl diphosphate reductase [Duncaniella sp.]|nr:4-hydroxy-3-methylbut-2-enyl diphosphate reductase [Duncaniella sp.]MDE6327314.1 4-hydroxy-3-methylbut-2-enyl diphosphate reductase [Duncaniella sp.]MDE6572373.1 4-hydroxy-3-methylbut-2-enyl diphosphate reductase [Duncaniella sp.]MDE6765051.1 4-hydroxy-3-methylbut-2-enyl diphosphate reductase [Duncaniella sp.]
MSEPIIEIDARSGFCHGVVTAIRKAEEELSRSREPLYCLGDIVHNGDEVERLEKAGLTTINHSDLNRLYGVRVLLRAHGEPPSTYKCASEREIEIIDATCPVVLQLQRRIKDTYDNTYPRPQIVIYGKSGHAEVNGLVGQTNGEAIVVESTDQLYKLDFTRDIALYSQTTMSLQGLDEMVREISNRISPDATFKYYDTICRQVANRVNHLREFAENHDVILFVAGAKSSNGKVLFNECLDVNPRSHLVSRAGDFCPNWIEGASSIGICGATSTPRWLMEQLKDAVQNAI